MIVFDVISQSEMQPCVIKVLVKWLRLKDYESYEFTSISLSVSL